MADLDPSAVEWVDTPIGKMVLKLYWARINKHIPQLDAAAALGMHASGLSRRERGLTDVSADELIRWADHLGFEVVLREKNVAPPMPTAKWPMTLRGDRGD